MKFDFCSRFSGKAPEGGKPTTFFQKQWGLQTCNLLSSPQKCSRFLQTDWSWPRVAVGPTGPCPPAAGPHPTAPSEGAGPNWGQWLGPAPTASRHDHSDGEDWGPARGQPEGLVQSIGSQVWQPGITGRVHAGPWHTSHQVFTGLTQPVGWTKYFSFAAKDPGYQHLDFLSFSMRMPPLWVTNREKKKNWVESRQRIKKFLVFT